MRASAEALTESRAKRCSSERTIAKADALSTTCSDRLTPMSVDVTPGRPQTQDSAIRAGLSPTSAATRFSSSTILQLRGVKSESPKGFAPSSRLSPSEWQPPRSWWRSFNRGTIVLTRQQTVGQGTPRYDSHAKLLGQRNMLILDIAID